MTAPGAPNSNAIASKAAWALPARTTAKLALSGSAIWSVGSPTVPNAGSIPAKSWKNNMRIWQGMGTVTGR